MEEIVKDLIESAKSNKITFSEPFYLSEDLKTIMGEVPFKQILFLDYRDTEAGSNPREYIGLKKTNIRIFNSLLTENARMFRFLHSGVITSLTTESISESDSMTVKYDECCLTNGNQTRFIILILTILKLLFSEEKLTQIKNKDYNVFIKNRFSDSEKIMAILNFIKFSKVSEIVREIEKKERYKIRFPKLDLSSFLNTRIRIQINVINKVIEDLDDKLDAYSAGTLIAEANNDTQNVKPDDIFGNKYKSELQQHVFNEFIDEYKGKVEIEYRYGEIANRSISKIHILALLRLIIPTGLLNSNRDIYKLTNQRIPIYSIFSKLISKINKGNQNALNTAQAVSKLIPLLFKVREEYVIPKLESLKRDLIRLYKKQAFANELADTVIGQDIYKAKGDDYKISKIIKSIVNYNVEHIVPVVIFRIRNLFAEDDGKISLNIPDDTIDSFLKTITQVIYENYVKIKLKGLPSSLTTVVRDKDFYDSGSESYTTFKNIDNLKETDFINSHQYILN